MDESQKEQIRRARKLMEDYLRETQPLVKLVGDLETAFRFMDTLTLDQDGGPAKVTYMWCSRKAFRMRVQLQESLDGITLKYERLCGAMGGPAKIRGVPYGDIIIDELDIPRPGDGES